MQQEIFARSMSQRISPQKARLVMDQIRGKGVEDALNILEYSKKRVSGIILTCLRSAISNAENNEGLDVDTLIVKTAQVDEGPSMKRFRPRARGRASRIIKRTSHLSISVLDGNTQ